jgi:hypothetical protein
MNVNLLNVGSSSKPKFTVDSTLDQHYMPAGLTEYYEHPGQKKFTPEEMSLACKTQRPWPWEKKLIIKQLL